MLVGKRCWYRIILHVCAMNLTAASANADACESSVLDGLAKIRVTPRLTSAAFVVASKAQDPSMSVRIS